jgi:DNA-directed RNA polymerase subunit RPC12/RpoP
MATSKRIELEGGGGDERCPYCGSKRVQHEQRDASADEHGNPPPPEAYGHWIVCNRCRREWPGEEPDLA